MAGCLSALGPSPEEQVREHRSHLERFTDVSTAVSGRYRMSPPFVQTDGGALGIPFVNLRIPDLEPTRPQVVLYELTDDGEYDLLGFEWFTPTSDADDPPELFGKSFHGPMDGETRLIPRHYGLHVWLFNENPDGMFKLYNPSVTRSNLVETITPAWEALSKFAFGAAAKEAGYRNVDECVRVADGGYGVPFVHDGAKGTDLARPPVLLYRVTPDWTYQLLGAEWYVSAEAVSEPPTMLGQPFHNPMEGHTPESTQPRHYGLHAWLFRPNPKGLFAQFNPTVSC